jgi:hypothetical protein
MELLPERIRRKGFFYDFVKRGEKAMIYKQTDVEDDFIVAYEVFKIKVDQPKVVFGIQLNEREIFPANEDFGKWAWSCPSLERAEKKFQYLETVVEGAQEEEIIEDFPVEGEDDE